MKNLELFTEMESLFWKTLAYLSLIILTVVVHIDIIHASSPYYNCSIEKKLYSVNSGGYKIPFHFNPAYRKIEEDESIGKISAPKLRIIGGVMCNPGSAPYQICIYMRGICHCGGAIYNSRTILTAAHCFHSSTAMLSQDLLDELTYIAGDFDAITEEESEQRRNAEDVIIHPDFKIDINLHDIAVIKLDEPFSYNKYVQPIPLGRRGAVPEEGPVAMVSGWGYTEKLFIDDDPDRKNYPFKLRKLNVKVFQRDECSNFFSKYPKTRKLVEGGLICAGSSIEGKDSCHGDSGGPLACYDKRNRWRRYLCGIISTGLGCGLKDLPGLYTRVGDYRDWIYRVAGHGDQRTIDDARRPLQVPD